MKVNEKTITDLKNKILAKYPRFGSTLASLNIEFKTDLPFHTAATDGKKIYIDPNYFENLNDNERMFIVAHEILHIKFMHMYRLKNKDGNIKDLNLWNIATDAIINANLERDGFTVKEGYVNMPEALNYSAEEFYHKLLREQEAENQEQNNDQDQHQEKDNQQSNGDNKQDKSQNNSQNQDNEQKQNNNQTKKVESDQNKSNAISRIIEKIKNKFKRNSQEQDDEQENCHVDGNENMDKNTNQNSEKIRYNSDDHSLWEEALNEQENPRNSKRGKRKTSGQQQTYIKFDEREEFKNNREEKIKNFNNFKNDFKNAIAGTQENNNTRNLRRYWRK